MVAGFDERKLLKIQLREGERAVPDFEAIPGIELVSQEDNTIILAFATEGALDDFEARLTNLARDGVATRSQLLFVISGFDSWAPEDRLGHAIREQGVPSTPEFVLDVELWPQDRADRRQALMQSFLTWARQNGMEILDEIRQPSLLMVRLRCAPPASDLLLRYRDVRTVDLPPRLGVTLELLQTDIQEIPAVQAPREGAPVIGVLDSGITSAHPLLGAALGDAQGFLTPRQAEDDNPWHGTFIAGLALYGDIEDRLETRDFAPEVRVVSGKVFRDDGMNDARFVESAVAEAVVELHRQYGCRVFNLSYGDLNKIYDGRHVRGLAYTLDRLTRELGVLFVVPTGNLTQENLPQDPLHEYPEFLFGEEARLLDPAPAVNVLTVGGLAYHEATRDARRYPHAREDHPLARTGQPFPFTRRGPSIARAIKPDLVDHAGNIAVDRSARRLRTQGVGVVSFHGGFAGGRLFSEDVGTSCAAPLVANKAVRLLTELPTASANLIRALLGAHARWPASSVSLLNPNDTAEGRDKLLQLIGYGSVDESALFRSLDDAVSLISEEEIALDQHHFYELPLPHTFWSRGRRSRHITVALAYSPVVRTTRLDYRMTKLWFTLVTASDLAEVTRAFVRNREEGMGERSSNRSIPNGVRRNGTLQASRWTFKLPLTHGEKVFVVVTRQDPQWSVVGEIAEPYALSVAIEDREVANSTLYVDIRAALQARAQARERVRVAG